MENLTIKVDVQISRKKGYDKIEVAGVSREARGSMSATELAQQVKEMLTSVRSDVMEQLACLVEKEALEQAANQEKDG